MDVDRERVLQAFKAYVAEYDAHDPKIALKAEHTLRVAGLCDQIARSDDAIGLDPDICWFVGILHDIGRFEQVRRWGTFYDSQSVNHAEFGADLLFREGLIERFVDRCDSCVEVAVRNHNRFRIQEGLDDLTLALCKVIRDADKIDILRVNVERPAQEIYGAPIEEIMAGDISPEVESAFYTASCVNRIYMDSLIDRRIGHFCFAFELEFPWSKQEMLRQGYLMRAMSVKSSNEVTEDKLAKMRSFMSEWLVDCADDTVLMVRN